MTVRNYTLYLSHKRKNISVGEIIELFGIMLQMSIYPRKMGWYSSYFMKYTMVHLWKWIFCSTQDLWFWWKDITILIILKKIISAFHPEARTSFCKENIYQPSYFIRMFNDKAKLNFSCGAWWFWWGRYFKEKMVLSYTDVEQG